MKKITYKTSNLFSMKKYDHADTLAQSYAYPTIYAIRCAIIGAIIQTKGIVAAEELFHKVKNSNIYIQYPKKIDSTYIKQRRLKADKGTVVSTMGVREYLNIDEIVIYIDNLIPNIDMYLKNIDWLGNAESMVYLSKIENVDCLKNVLVKSSFLEEIDVYEQHDWNSKTKFENIYKFTAGKKHIHDTFMCKIADIHL